jgi:acyl-CoA synthetase (AMP-forming)/AMP-acid ligase II
MKINVMPDSVLLGGIRRVIEVLNEGGKYAVSTSGTTGTPKVITVDLAKALARKRAGSKNERWLLTYGPERWAGISVVLHVVKTDCEICVPKNQEMEELIKAAITLRPTHVSFTPSLFRNLVRYDKEGALAKCAFEQVTFGGECASQSVLDLARKLWPLARVSHVYATTETGDVCAVSDGKEGVPIVKFSKYSFSPDGELIVDGLNTGDIWDLRGERYYFSGRKNDIINVGGNKISPLAVEEYAISCGATMAKAYSMPSPLMGALVALDYVGGPDTREIAILFRKNFPRFACPAQLRQVDIIELTNAGKTKRTS